MTSKAFGATITGTGEYVFPVTEGRYALFSLTGGFGSGTAPTAQPGYDDGAGNFVAFDEEISTAVAKAWKVTMPISGKLALKVLDSSGATLVVNVKPLET